MNNDLPRCCTVPVQVVPYGIESVNGSDVNMGCTSPLVDRGSVRVCESISHLVDGCSPDIDTKTSDWASQLVTMRERFTDDINFWHVLLTFVFDTAVSLTGIELDLFLCPEMEISAPLIYVYGNEEDNLVFTYPLAADLPFIDYSPTQSSCSSLSTVSIPFGGTALDGQSFRTWYILSSQTGLIDWFHVGEVRFLGENANSLMICTTTVSTTTYKATSKNISY